ncbi:DMT family transporter [Nonomuraea guangzhouensis]|uniref:DMT family transporter n=1 Tax=Nonomuraea guangzhouensis TaxID=1291555 RepID=A0ABW4G596_9ACTN|nr:EamA family transporter [Nonomuraea guangzhouensis]
MSHVSARRGTFYVSVAATAWGTGGAAGSLLFQSGGLDPVDVSFWRYLLGAAFLYAAACLRSALTRPTSPAARPGSATAGPGSAITRWAAAVSRLRSVITRLRAVAAPITSATIQSTAATNGLTSDVVRSGDVGGWGRRRSLPSGVGGGQCQGSLPSAVGAWWRPSSLPGRVGGGRGSLPGRVGGWRGSLQGRVNRRVLVVGVGMAIYQTAYFGAIAQSGVAIATVVTMGATPVFTALGSRFLLREHLGRAALAALATALGGLFLLTGESAISAGDTGNVGGGRPAGIALALVSAAGYAAVTLYSRRHHDDPRRTAMGGFAVAAACLAPFALAGGVLPAAGVTPVALLLYLGAVPTALAYALFFRALTALNATTVSIISLGEAVGAAVLGVVVFGERLALLAWCGCALLLAAVVVLAVQAGRMTDKD